MKCEFCDRKNVSHKGTPEGRMCQYCYPAILGKSFSQEYDRVFENDDLCLWIRDNKVVYAWVDKGNIAVPRKVFRNLSIPETIRLLSIQRLFCTDCACSLTNDTIGHRHFAGLYCFDCTRLYRDAHKEACMLCNRPRHSCTC